MRKKFHHSKNIPSGYPVLWRNCIQLLNFFFQEEKGAKTFFEKKTSEAKNNTKLQKNQYFIFQKKVEGQNVIYVGSSESGVFIGVVFESPDLTI